MLRFLLFLSAALGLSASASAQPASPAAAVVEFIDAMQSADPARLEGIIWASQRVEAHKQFKALVIEVISSQRRLERIAADRLGGDDKPLDMRLGLIFSQEDREAASRSIAVFDSDGSMARVSIPGCSSTVRLRFSNERWMVVLDPIELIMDDESGPLNIRQPKEEARITLDRYRAVRDAVTQTADRINGGQLTSAQAAITEMQDKISAADAEFSRRLEQFRRNRGRRS